MITNNRHCEEAKPTRQSSAAVDGSGLLRFARNDKTLSSIIHHPSSKKENGNVFFLVMIGIALFGALVMTVSRSSNTKSSNILTRKQAELAATELMNYSQTVARGVGRLTAGNNCSENQISAEPPPYDGSTAYVNPDAPGDFTCHIFHPSGGSVAYQTFPELWQETGTGGLTLSITGTTCIPGIGTGDDGTCLGNSDATESELLFVLSNLKTNLCTQINTALGAHAETVSIGITETPFTGPFTDTPASGTDTTELENNYTTTDSACFQGSDYGRYYKVLLAR